MNIDLTPEQLKQLYEIVKDNFRIKSGRLDWSEERVRFKMYYDPEEECLSDVLKARLELSSRFEVMRILEKYLGKEEE